MIHDRLDDGTRIAQLLASELTGDRDDLAQLSVTDADPDVEPTPDGALAYRVVHGSDDTKTTIAEVFVQPDRVRVEFLVVVDDSAQAADSAGLRVRPKAVRPPRTLVFVEDGAQVKWILPTFETVVGLVDRR